MMFKSIFKLGNQHSSNKELLDSLSEWFKAVKYAPILAMPYEKATEKGIIDKDGTVKTKEGKVKAKPGSMICKGVEEELWVQTKNRLEENS